MYAPDVWVKSGVGLIAGRAVRPKQKRIRNAVSIQIARALDHYLSPGRERADKQKKHDHRQQEEFLNPTHGITPFCVIALPAE
jgi:hypothetical protein